MSSLQSNFHQHPSPPSKVFVTVRLPMVSEFGDFARAAEVLTPVAEGLKQALKECAAKWLTENIEKDRDGRGYEVKAEIIY